jgi:hypothetical protein
MPNTTITVIESKNQKFQFDVHTTGCRDLKKYDTGVRMDAMKFKSLDQMDAELLDAGDETNPGWDGDAFKIFPCTNRD